MYRFFAPVGLAVTALLVLSTGVRADGITDIRINPATGVTISISGSYRLVSDVTMTANAVAVQINAQNTTLDLGGHTIRGFAGNTLDGISSTVAGVTIINGTIIGFGDGGVDTSSTTNVIRGVRVLNCNQTGGSAGLRVGSEGIVENCFVSGSIPPTGSVTGIQIGSQSRAAGNIVEGNISTDTTTRGINAGSHCLISDNVVDNNVGASASECIGIYAFEQCLVRNNTVTNTVNNGTGNAVGIVALAGSTVEGNVCADQGTATTGTASSIGIRGDNAIIVGNNCHSNSAGNGSNGHGVGIQAQTGTLVRNNRCSLNGGVGLGFSSGILTSQNTVIESNFCRGNAGGAVSHGIRVTGASNLIKDNALGSHTHGGIIFLSASSNRCENNRGDESEIIETNAAAPFDAVAPDSVGTGTLANVAY